MISGPVTWASLRRRTEWALDFVHDAVACGPDAQHFREGTDYDEVKRAGGAWDLSLRAKA